MSVTCVQCEPAFICEENGGPAVDLPVLLFFGKLSWAARSGPHVMHVESGSSYSLIKSWHK